MQGTQANVYRKRFVNPFGNQKGLTLIELLAVVVILGIIALIAIPSIGGIINNTKKNAHRANAQIIIDAARYMVINNGFKSDTTDGELTITYEELLEDGFLEKEIKDPENTSRDYDQANTVVTVSPNTQLGFDYSITLMKRGTGAGVAVFANNPVPEDELRTANFAG